MAHCTVTVLVPLPPPRTHAFEEVSTPALLNRVGARAGAADLAPHGYNASHLLFPGNRPPDTSPDTKRIPTDRSAICGAIQARAWSAPYRPGLVKARRSRGVFGGYNANNAAVL